VQFRSVGNFSEMASRVERGRDVDICFRHGDKRTVLEVLGGRKLRVCQWIALPPNLPRQGQFPALPPAIYNGMRGGANAATFPTRLNRL
jgi:hypothetical protein